MRTAFFLAPLISVALMSCASGAERKPLLDWADPPKGSLVIIGGALRFDDPAVWQETVRLAADFRKQSGKAEGKPRILVFPTASGEPEIAGKRLADTLNRYHADAVIAPLVAPGRPAIAPPEEASLERIAALVKEADGVFFSGGNQARILKALFAESGEPNEVLAELLGLYRRGGVIAGTSAGAAVMSRIAFSNPGSILSTMIDGVRLGEEADYGLGVMHPDWFIDQHCLVRGRFARSLALMRQFDFKYGLGIDENTAMVVSGETVTIVGYRGAVFANCAEAQRDAQQTGYHWRGVKLTYLDRGDRLNLRTLEVTPSPAKLEGEKIDAGSPNYDPGNTTPIFSCDILSNTTLLDVMERLMNASSGEAMGLCFDGYAARNSATPGFEFRFYRGRDTVAWSTSALGDSTATVQNVYLDIRPVQIGPLYPVAPAQVAARPAPAAVKPARPAVKPAPVVTYSQGRRYALAPAPLRRLLFRR